MMTSISTGFLPFRCIMWRETRFSFTPVLMKKRVICGNGETSEDVFTSKYPAETGKIEGLDMKVVAGHVGTAEISGDKFFHDIYFDGESHYYIDGTVLDSGVIPVLMVDTENDEYYQVTDSGKRLIEPYEE